MINLPQGFKIGSTEAIDDRLLLSKSEMVSMNDNIMPEMYFAVCRDNGKMYLYSKTNESNSETGKFRLLSGGLSSNYTKEEANLIISSDSDNILFATDNGLKVSDYKTIPSNTITSLFIEKE